MLYETELHETLCTLSSYIHTPMSLYRVTLSDGSISEYLLDNSKRVQKFLKMILSHLSQIIKQLIWREAKTARKMIEVGQIYAEEGRRIRINFLGARIV